MRLNGKVKTELAMKMAYKVAIAEEWARLGKGKLHFFLVHNGNVDVVLNKIKGL